MKKIFILDTSVFAHDPKCFLTFENSTVVIPITVLEELDKIKSYANESGKNARVAIRAIDEISNKGELHIGIKCDNGVLLKTDISNYGSIGSDPKYGDSRILACALEVKKSNKKDTITLVSRDFNLRIRAKALGLLAQHYEKDSAVGANDLFSGFQVVKCEDGAAALKECGVISVKNYPELWSLYPNECVVLTDKKGKGLASGRRIKDEIKIVNDISPWGLELRNKEQLFASELIMDTNIPLVSLVGKAGSGKTLTALACSLELILNKRKYDQLVIYRPIQPVGSDLGYLPGSLEDKLLNWFSAIDDGFAVLFSDKSKKKEGWKAQLHQYIDNGTIQKEALTYIRGRSIPNSLILFDEVQNISKEEIKTVLTRVGMNSKIILTGDIQQIDNPKLDAMNNGLTYTVEKFKESELAGHITFTKGERSAIATLAAEIL